MQERKTNRTLCYLACKGMVFEVVQLQRNCDRELDNSQSKIFVSELDNSNWELYTSLWKIFVLELDSSN